ncbi:MAG: DUF4164 family protein [Aestuariivirgaceae bacterium]
MSDKPRIEDALTRFESALEGLETAVAQAKQQNDKPAAIDGETAALREDRARLAEELDQVRDNANKLLEANTEAESRIASAMERIQTVLSE